ncbi:unnamed protein product [Amoebophrya sp. A120]|nr:unnamed protein product [Amoebophrya sp. A120]|eukprot:GSA120T00021010001.1
MAAATSGIDLQFVAAAGGSAPPPGGPRAEESSSLEKQTLETFYNANHNHVDTDTEKASTDTMQPRGVSHGGRRPEDGGGAAAPALIQPEGTTSTFIPATSSSSVFFQFRPRAGRINWRYLQHLDIDTIKRDGDVETLEKIADNLTFACFNNEDLEIASDVEVKRFVHLLQLVTEYYFVTGMQKNAAKVYELRKADSAKGREIYKLETMNRKLLKELKDKRRQVSLYENLLQNYRTGQGGSESDVDYRIKNGLQQTGLFEVDPVLQDFDVDAQIRATGRASAKEDRRGTKLVADGDAQDHATASASKRRKQRLEKDHPDPTSSSAATDLENVTAAGVVESVKKPISASPQFMRAGVSAATASSSVADAATSRLSPAKGSSSSAAVRTAGAASAKTTTAVSHILNIIYQCPCCSKRFESQEFLQRHLARRHPEVDIGSIDFAKCRINRTVGGTSATSSPTKQNKFTEEQFRRDVIAETKTLIDEKLEELVALVFGGSEGATALEDGGAAGEDEQDPTSPGRDAARPGGRPTGEFAVAAALARSQSNGGNAEDVASDLLRVLRERKLNQRQSLEVGEKVADLLKTERAKIMRGTGGARTAADLQGAASTSSSRAAGAASSTPGMNQEEIMQERLQKLDEMMGMALTENRRLADTVQQLQSRNEINELRLEEIAKQDQVNTAARGPSRQSSPQQGGRAGAVPGAAGTTGITAASTDMLSTLHPLQRSTLLPETTAPGTNFDLDTNAPHSTSGAPTVLTQGVGGGGGTTAGHLTSSSTSTAITQVLYSSNATLFNKTNQQNDLPPSAVGLQRHLEISSQNTSFSSVVQPLYNNEDHYTTTTKNGVSVIKERESRLQDLSLNATKLSQIAAREEQIAREQELATARIAMARDQRLRAEFLQELDDSDAQYVQAPRRLSAYSSLELQPGGGASSSSQSPVKMRGTSSRGHQNQQGAATTNIKGRLVDLVANRSGDDSAKSAASSSRGDFARIFANKADSSLEMQTQRNHASSTSDFGRGGEPFVPPSAPPSDNLAATNFSMQDAPEAGPEDREVTKLNKSTIISSPRLTATLLQTQPQQNSEDTTGRIIRPPASSGAADAMTKSSASSVITNPRAHRAFRNFSDSESGAATEIMVDQDQPSRSAVGASTVGAAYEDRTKDHSGAQLTATNFESINRSALETTKVFRESSGAATDLRTSSESLSNTRLLDNTRLQNETATGLVSRTGPEPSYTTSVKDDVLLGSTSNAATTVIYANNPNTIDKSMSSSSATSLQQTSFLLQTRLPEDREATSNFAGQIAPPAPQDRIPPDTSPKYVNAVTSSTSTSLLASAPALVPTVLVAEKNLEKPFERGSIASLPGVVLHSNSLETTKIFDRPGPAPAGSRDDVASTASRGVLGATKLESQEPTQLDATVLVQTRLADEDAEIDVAATNITTTKLEDNHAQEGTTTSTSTPLPATNGLAGRAAGLRDNDAALSSSSASTLINTTATVLLHNNDAALDTTTILPRGGAGSERETSPALAAAAPGVVRESMGWNVSTIFPVDGTILPEQETTLNRSGTNSKIDDKSSFLEDLQPKDQTRIELPSGGARADVGDRSKVDISLTSASDKTSIAAGSAAGAAGDLSKTVDLVPADLTVLEVRSSAEVAGNKSENVIAGEPSSTSPPDAREGRFPEDRSKTVAPPSGSAAPPPPPPAPAATQQNDLSDYSDDDFEIEVDDEEDDESPKPVLAGAAPARGSSPPPAAPVDAAGGNEQDPPIIAGGSARDVEGDTTNSTSNTSSTATRAPAAPPAPPSPPAKRTTSPDDVQVEPVERKTDKLFSLLNDQSEDESGLDVSEVDELLSSKDKDGNGSKPAADVSAVGAAGGPLTTTSQAAATAVLEQTRLGNTTTDASVITNNSGMKQDQKPLDATALQMNTRLDDVDADDEQQVDALISEEIAVFQLDSKDTVGGTSNKKPGTASDSPSSPGDQRAQENVRNYNTADLDFSDIDDDLEDIFNEGGGEAK